MTSMSNERNNTNHSNQPDHEGSDQSPDRAKSLTLEYGKSIKLLRNGDEFYTGQKVVINSRKYRYFDVFLDDLSNTINARFGAVRAIHTPLHGHKIKSLDQIEDGKVYVAAGAGKFKRMNYLDIAQGRKPKPARLPALNRTPPQLSNIQSRPLFEKSGNLFIYVYKNGDVLTPPVKVLLYKHQLTKFEAVLNEVTDKVQLSNGAVLRLFTMEGDEITTTQQLLNGHAYVATNKDKFKRCEYFSPEDFGVSPRMLRKVNSQPTSYNGSTASTSGKSAFSYSGKPYTGWHPSRDEVGSLKPIRKLRNPPPTKQINVDKDDSGLYKARRNQHSREAREIPDNEHMLVDMPVDMREAQEIDDEEIGESHRNAKQKPRDKSQNRKPHFEQYVDDERPPTPPSKNQKQANNSKKSDNHGAVITDKSDSPVHYNASSTSHTYNQDNRDRDNGTATSYHENHTNDDYESQHHHQKSDPYDNSRQDTYDDDNKHQSTRTQQQDHHDKSYKDDDYQMYNNNNNNNHSSNDNHKTSNHHNDTYNYDDHQQDDHHDNNNKNRTFTEDDHNTDRHNDTTYVDHSTTNNNKSTKKPRTKNDLSHEEAATLIQASYKGYKTRKDLKQGKYNKTPNYQENANDNNSAEVPESSADIINQDPITSTSTSNINTIHRMIFEDSEEEPVEVESDSDADENNENNNNAELQTKYLPEEIRIIEESN